jgi:glycosyltransferase involved in cell wall biosynthesis
MHVDVRVFFTWHGGNTPVADHGFGKAIAWDIPLTDGYGHEVVPNIARSPGSHHFLGLRNPELPRAVFSWKPDVVHITGYSYASHLKMMWGCHRGRIPSMFRGDSHLLNENGGVRQILKKCILRRVFGLPSAFLCVGTHNREYYRAFGVPESRLFPCPHSIDVERFAGTGNDYEQQAANWRARLGIKSECKTVLFAGKFEPNKRPIEFMKCFLSHNRNDTVLIMVGDGQLADNVRTLASRHPEQVRVLPFQNQSMMPIVYRLSDIFVLPSKGETWGLAVNEALACGRKVLVSDRVGCAADIVHPGWNGDVFACGNWTECGEKLNHLLNDTTDRANAISERAQKTFGFDVTMRSVLHCVEHLCNRR